jgi:hypothetical protein
LSTQDREEEELVHDLDSAIAKLKARFPAAASCPRGPASFDGWGLGDKRMRLRGGADSATAAVSSGGGGASGGGGTGWGGSGGGGAAVAPPNAWSQAPPSGGAGAQGGPTWGPTSSGTTRSV